MAGRQSSPRRSAEHAWFITGPLAILAVIWSHRAGHSGVAAERFGQAPSAQSRSESGLMLVVMVRDRGLDAALRHPAPVVQRHAHRDPAGPGAVLPAAADRGADLHPGGPDHPDPAPARHRRSSGSTWRRPRPRPRWPAGAARASRRWRASARAPGASSSPRSSTITLVDPRRVVGVITLVQGRQAGWEVARTAGAERCVTAAINVAVGLIFLIALDTTLVVGGAAGRRWPARWSWSTGRTRSSSGSTAPSPTSTT